MIEMEHVFVRYGDIESLIDIHLRIERGEFIYLYGASGSGKTSFLKLITREIIPESGKVHIDGKDLAAFGKSEVQKLRRRIGFAYQDFRLLWKKTVFENMEFVLHAVREKEDIIFEKVCGMLKLVGLLGKKDILIPHLSYGEQRCLSIARALVNTPDIILADEPTTDLEPHVRKEIMRILNNIVHQEKTTVILATREKMLIDEYPHRVINLKDGRIGKE